MGSVLETMFLLFGDLIFPKCFVFLLVTLRKDAHDFDAIIGQWVTALNQQQKWPQKNLWNSHQGKHMA